MPLATQGTWPGWPGRTRGLRSRVRTLATPSPLTRYQRLALRLAFALESHLRQHPGQGEMFVAPFDVVYSYYDIVDTRE